jgi:hypothetical protein
MKYLWVTLKGKVRITSPFYMTISMVIGGIFLPLYGCIGRASALPVSGYTAKSSAIQTYYTVCPVEGKSATIFALDI